jgi:hypothetical protein
MSEVSVRRLSAKAMRCPFPSLTTAGMRYQILLDGELLNGVDQHAVVAEIAAGAKNTAATEAGVIVAETADAGVAARALTTVTADAARATQRRASNRGCDVSVLCGRVVREFESLTDNLHLSIHSSARGVDDSTTKSVACC